MELVGNLEFEESKVNDLCISMKEVISPVDDRTPILEEFSHLNVNIPSFFTTKVAERCDDGQMLGTWTPPADLTPPFNEASLNSFDWLVQMSRRH